MKENEEVCKVLERYRLVGAPEITKQRKGTHLSFQVKANNRTFVLRQYSEYMQPKELRVQLQFAKFMKEAGLSTVVPIHSIKGESFVKVNERLWTLFPWCEGRLGKDEQMVDLGILASTQGVWIQCCEKLRANPNWRVITSTSKKFRQRKSWAWVVPLDQIPQFFESHKVISRIHERVKRGNYEREYSDRLISLLHEVELSINAFVKLLDERGVGDLPHTVTHGDFTLGNIRINDGDGFVLDLDCFSYEPRIADFTRTLNHYFKKQNESVSIHLFERFQTQAKLSRGEVEVLPLMMCAYDLYYAVMHILLFLEEEGNTEDQKQMIKAIEHEIKKCEGYGSEYAEVLFEI
jgi:Ser/Thr protein kinase RdoA (MazF antagonist)